MPKLEIVVARHRERVDWTRNLPRQVAVTIYDKGGDLDPAAYPRARVLHLPNVGREAHTYLTHLTTQPPAPVTFFCQGHPFDHAPDLRRVVAAVAAGARVVPGFLWLGFIIDTDDPRGRRLFVPWSKNPDRCELALDQFHQALFGAPPPDAFRFYPGGQFAVTAELCAARPRELYARALALAAGFPDAAHCFERTWDRLFGVVGVDHALLGDALCRYLKPVRRRDG
jgi:hypothetical protein